MRKASDRWHTIWCADMRPHRRTLSGRTVFNRRASSALSRGRARVFTSPPEKSLPACLAERGQRPPAARLRFRQHVLESGIVPERVELPASGQGGGDEVALGDRASQLPQAPLVLADV